MAVAQVLAKYQKRELTTKEIAAKHGISMATITVWAKKAGFGSSRLMILRREITS